MLMFPKPPPVVALVPNISSTSSAELRKKTQRPPPELLFPSKHDLLEYRDEANPKRWTEACKHLCFTSPHELRLLLGETFYIPIYRREWHEVMGATPKERQLNVQKRAQLAAKEHYVNLINTMELSPKGFPHDHHNCVRVKINVGGRIFETQRRTLRRYPQTLLGSVKRMAPFFDPNAGCYYFDRSRESFEAILYYYQSGGRLRRPPNTSLETFYGDILFYDLGDDVLSNYRAEEGVVFDSFDNVPTNMLKRKIWLLFECPESSSQAAIVSMASVITVILSVTAFVGETLSMFREKDEHNFIESIRGGYDIFQIIETVCVIWFCLEYFCRIISCPCIRRFILDWMNFIDVISVLPFFLQVITDETSAESNPASQTTYLTVLRTIRLVRVFRVFKLSRHSKGLQILGLTLRASMRELGLLIFFLAIGVILFSSAIYFAELEVGPMSGYSSIPATFYWSIVTMTTVGYGDIVPVTVLGKLIGSLCAVAGVLTIALPVPVIVSNFNYFYHLSTDEKRIENNIINVHHVQMCPFLATEGVAPLEPQKPDSHPPSTEHSSQPSK